MRSKHTLALLLILLVVSVPVGLYVHQHNKLESAWESVNQAAVRLESSIQYEPAIVVRTKMAELDAALNNYKTVKEGLLVGRFEKGNDGKFQDLEQTLSHLSIGLKESSHDRMQIVEEDWPPFKVDTFPADDLHRYCSEGKLYILISELGAREYFGGAANPIKVTGRRERRGDLKSCGGGGSRTPRPY
jgi:hypothetical protein